MFLSYFKFKYKLKYISLSIPSEKSEKESLLAGIFGNRLQVCQANLVITKHDFIGSMLLRCERQVDILKLTVNVKHND